MKVQGMLRVDNGENNLTGQPSRKIHNIKFLRKVFGLGLKEAKEMCESPATTSYPGLKIRMSAEQYVKLTWLEPQGSPHNVWLDNVRIVDGEDYVDLS